MKFDVVGIRYLAECMTRSGGLAGVSSGISPKKARKGEKIHREIQKSREAELENYCSEKEVIYTFAPENFGKYISASGDGTHNGTDIDAHSEEDYAPFVLEGRTDGCCRLDNEYIIDEIKSSDELPDNYNKTHYAQALIYAFILSRDLPADGIVTINLIYSVFKDSSTRKLYTFSLSPEETEQQFFELVSPYGRFLKLQEDHCEKLDRQLGELPFSFDTFRKGQRELSVNVYSLINRGDYPMLLCHAPTGIGKTSGVLYPALKAQHFSASENSEIFYLTSRGEGARPVVNALDVFRKNAPELRYCVLTSKEKMCPYIMTDGGNERSQETAGSDDGPDGEMCFTRCRTDICPRAQHHNDKINEAVGEALISGINAFSRETLLSLSDKYGICPFELGLDVSMLCDVIIGDYNYLFDPDAYLKRYFADPGADGKCGSYVYLIDEAHNLPDRARSMYSKTLSSRSFDALRKGRGKRKCGKLLKRLSEELINIYEAAGVSGQEAVLSEFPETLMKLLNDYLTACEDYLDAHDDDELLASYFDIISFKKLAEMTDDAHFAFISRGEGILPGPSDDRVSSVDADSETETKATAADRSAEFSILCLDASEIIKAKCLSGKCSVLFSGTLKPEKYFVDAFLADGMPFYIADSPFPRENLSVTAAVHIDTRYKVRKASVRPLAELVESVGSGIGRGNIIVYFSSYSYLRDVYAALDENFAHEFVTVQPSSADPEAREKFLKEFVEDPSGIHVGFCVMGGNFSEGVDLTGTRLTGVIIAGAGLPQVNYITELIRSKRDAEKPGEGFDCAYFYPGLNKVIQAAGRVIRTETDRGFVILCDSRYSGRRYRDNLPASWQYKTFTDTEKIVSETVAFLNGI